MRAEIITTPLARISGKENDALKIECDVDELPHLTRDDTEFIVGGKRYYFSNHQSFGNTTEEDSKATIWLFAD